MSPSLSKTELLEIFSDQAPLQSLAPGELLLRRHEALEHLLVVVAGELVAEPPRGGPADHRLGPGQAFAPLDDVGSPVDLRATRPTEVYRVPPEVVLRLMAEHARALSDLLADAEGLVEALLEEAGEESLGTLLLAYGPRGGVGTTTGAVLAAHQAALTGASVLLVEVHRWFGTAALACDVCPEQDLLDVLEGEPTAEALAYSVERTPGGFDLLAAALRPERGERLPRGAFPELVDVARRAYDVVLLDLASGLDPLTLDALELARDSAGARVLLFLDASLEGAATGRQALEALDVLGVPEDAVSPIFNGRRADSPFPEEVLLRTLGLPAAVVPDLGGPLAQASARGELASSRELLETPLARVLGELLQTHLGLALAPSPGRPAPWFQAPSLRLSRLLEMILGAVGLRSLLAS